MLNSSSKKRSERKRGQEREGKKRRHILSNEGEGKEKKEKRGGDAVLRLSLPRGGKKEEGPLFSIYSKDG